MTRKHFQAIADTIKQLASEGILMSPDSEERDYPHYATAEAFADLCEQYNDNFKRDRFLKACGIEVRNG